MPFIRARDKRKSAGQRVLETILAQYPIFSGLSPARLARLIPYLMVKEFADEEIVCHCPDAFHDAFIIVNGAAAVTRKKGELVYTVQLERRGAVFNVGKLVDAEREAGGARCLGKVQILALDTARLKQLLEKEPDLGYPFLRNICNLTIDQYERQIEHYIEQAPN